MPLFQAIRSKRALAPRIREGLPTPAVAFCGPSAPQGFYDPGLRGTIVKTTTGLPRDTPIGPGVFPLQNNTDVYLGSHLGAVDLDTASSITAVATVFVESGGTFTGEHSRFRAAYGTAGARIYVAYHNTGLVLGWPQNINATYTETVVPAADAVGRVFTFVLSAKDDEFLAYMNGRLIKREAYSGKAWPTFGTSLFGFGGGSGSGTEGVQVYTQGALWFGQHDADWLERLSRGPEELWEPERIWVPFTSGGGGPQTFFQTITGSLSTQGSPFKHTETTKQSTITTSAGPVVGGQFSQSAAGSITISSVLTDAFTFVRAYASSLTLSGAIAKPVYKVLSGTITLAGSVYKAITKATITASLALSGALSAFSFTPGPGGGALGRGLRFMRKFIGRR